MERAETAVFERRQSFLNTVFVSGLLGSALAVLAVYSGRLVCLSGDKTMWYTAAMLVPSALALLLTSSVLGLALLPACVFMWGFAVSFLAACISPGAELLELIIPQLLAAPVLFIISTLGMYNSAELCRAFSRSAAKQRNLWGKRFVFALTAASALVFVAYLFI